VVQPYNQGLAWQQRVSTFALVAAFSSFTLGVMLPWNLRLQRRSAAPPVSQAIPENSAPIVAAPPEISPADASPNAPVPPAETDASNSGISPIKTAIAERVAATQVSLQNLEDRRFNFTVPERFQGKTIRSVNLGGEHKAIALTFDDGPWPTTTDQILKILKENNIKATFFWIGVTLSEYREIGKRVANEGHALANHTWNHRYYKYGLAQATEQIDRLDNLIAELTGTRSFYFRPPGGVLNNGLVDYAFSRNYANIMWSVDSQDWKSSAEAIAKNVIANAKPGGIVLMHDGGGNRSQTVKALPIIIKELKQQGYEFVTVPELLQMADEHMTNEEIAAQEKEARELSGNSESGGVEQSPQ
jgi:peptidoglycan/xylan/chitin deacetylase (PgdA/CDA1 family)